MSSNKTLIGILFLFLLSCADDEVVGNTLETSLAIDRNQQRFEQTSDNLDQDIIESDAFNLINVEIEDLELLITVSYAGGCKQHEFEVIWPEAITLIYPPDFGVVLIHESNDDSCEAFLTETLVFDLKNNELGLSDQELNEMRITVINGSNPDETKSNR